MERPNRDGQPRRPQDPVLGARTARVDNDDNERRT